jgi:hypothetical protein
MGDLGAAPDEGRAGVPPASGVLGGSGVVVALLILAPLVGIGVGK